MNRSRIDQFRRAQIYTPPPADYELEERPRGLGRKWLPVNWIVATALVLLGVIIGRSFPL